MATQFENESTAVVSTLEKCREISGCPAGVDLQVHLRQLAAENVGLKAAAEFATAPDMWIEQADGMLDYRYCDWYVDVLKAAMETPATDRIVAGIKADGVEWKEGAEPSEFGRYWVRYETDIGPQYCSAQWIEHNFCASSTTNIHKIWLADHSRSINSLKDVTHYTKLPAALEGGAA
ncbi:hypothetical protein [Raoultella ornithinolytica]|uniref:Uncharacterized protein n=1 Tax=Raoultella ornithinolytica TaxID=54291 RepID=A0A9Q9J764_RAOOR|nr:hypothetical protein [Raoultella ornithinolytica]UXE36179.1 hypothetical protein N2J37_16630 [Raoultella ornithinolytica]